MGRTKTLPILPMSSPWTEQIECPICYYVKIDGSVIRSKCMRIICAAYALCIIVTQGNNATCGYCRGELFDPDNELGRTTLCSLPPDDIWLFDILKFSCPESLENYDLDTALCHPNQCPKNKKFKPDHIHGWKGTTITQHTMISNPPREAPPRTKDRLIVVHFNGQQVFSKVMRLNSDMGDVKVVAAKSLTTPRN